MQGCTAPCLNVRSFPHSSHTSRTLEPYWGASDKPMDLALPLWCKWTVCEFIWIAEWSEAYSHKSWQVVIVKGPKSSTHSRSQILLLFSSYPLNLHSLKQHMNHALTPNVCGSPSASKGCRDLWQQRSIGRNFKSQPLSHCDGTDFSLRKWVICASLSYCELLFNM